MPPANKPRVLIFGGGITGLTAAYTLERESDFEICLMDTQPKLGGKIQTLQQDGFRIEEGPDSVFAGKVAALELISQLDLEDEVVEPKTRGYYLLLDGRLQRVPKGLASLSGIDPSAIEEATFLTEEAKVRALAEPTVPPAIVVDESISHFFTRRFGFEFSRLVAEPILAGTQAGNPDKLSMRALYPQFLDREAQNGNLGFTDPDTRKTATPTFVSFRTGMSTLVETLRNNLKRTQMTLGVETASLEESNDGILWTGSNPQAFSAVLLAIPAREGQLVLSKVNAEASSLLGEIEFASSAVVTAAYDADSLPGELQGTGFLAPYDEFALLTGSTWTSAKWPDRAPEERVLLRFFYGGAGRPSLPASEELIVQSRSDAQITLGIRAEPLFTKVSEYVNGMPQYTLGHTGLVDRIEDSLDGSAFTVAGSSYRGVGIPDCIRQGRDAARKIAKELA